MYVSNMKRNARKSTHSGKARQTVSTFQGFQSTSSHSALNQNSNLPSVSPLHSHERSIWDTEFTAPKPTRHSSSSDVIILSEEPAVKLVKPIPGNVVKGCVASLKNKLKPDRNIFSALTKPASPNQRSSNSKPPATPANQNQRSINIRPPTKPANQNQQNVVIRPPANPTNQNQWSINIRPPTKPANQNQQNVVIRPPASPTNQNQRSINIRPPTNPANQNQQNVVMRPPTNQNQRSINIRPPAKPANQSKQIMVIRSPTNPINQNQRSTIIGPSNKPANQKQQTLIIRPPINLANQNQRTLNNRPLTNPANQIQRTIIIRPQTSLANQNQWSLNSRPSTTTTKHTPAILHHPSKTSKNFARLYGSEFVFKKPTAPPPVSRLHLSSSSSRASQPSTSRSTAKSGHGQNRQRNKHRNYSSETRRFTAHPPKARSGAKRRPQNASESCQKFCRDNLFSSRPFLEESNWSSALGGNLSSSNSKLSDAPGNDRSLFQTSRRWSQFSSSQTQKSVRTKSTGRSPHKGVSQSTKKRFAIKRALMKQNISHSGSSKPFIDLSREKTAKKTHTVVRAPNNHFNLNRVRDPHYVTQLSIEALSRRKGSSAPKSVPPLEAQSSTNLLHTNVQSSPNSQSISQQKSPSNIGAGSTDSAGVKYNNSCSVVKVIPTEKLEFRLSPLKFETEDSGNFDEVDGLLFVSFRTRSGLESYLKTPYEKPVRPVNGPSGAVSSLPPHSAFKQTSPQQATIRDRIALYERQLKKDLHRSSNKEILSPVLQYYRFSIKENLISIGARSINFRNHGIRLYSKKVMNYVRRKRRLRESRNRCKNEQVQKKRTNCKEPTATRTTGLKIKFSVPGLRLTNNSFASKIDTASKQDLELNLTSISNSTSPEETQEQTSPKTTSNKLPLEESIPFKPFEKEVTSAKSAFISDALDKYLEDEKVQPPSLLNSYVHPLLQNKASSVTFKMPSKQSSSFKTLDMALHQRQMARIKSKVVPTVAQTAEKLAKKLHHYSGSNKITNEQAVLSGNEKGNMDTPLASVTDKETDSQHALQTEVKEASVAPGEKAITDASRKEINPKEKSSVEERMESVRSLFDNAMLKTKQIRTQQQSSRIDTKRKESALEERLETVKNKLRRTPALRKKSPYGGKSQTNWVTKFKIVNSRLVQQLNTPGQGAHLINPDKDDQIPQEESDELPSSQIKKIKIEKGCEPSADTSAAEGKRYKDKSRDKGKEKNKSKNEFFRLDHQIPCTKEFCRLGCICASINHSQPVDQLTKHCRKLACMFECVCQRTTDSVRILRTRKRPNIFQESSMLFYDGLGMFSNNAYTDTPVKNPGEKKTGILQSLKPKTGGNMCARAKVYRGKPGAPKRTKQYLPDQSTAPKVQAPTGTIQSQSQGLPKSIKSNTKASSGNSQNVFIPTGTSASQTRKTVQTVLYTPVHLPVAGQANPVVLYAPVNRLPGMTQRPKSAVVCQQQSEKEADGSTPRSQPMPVESELPQIPLSSESRTVDNKVRPVAVVSPSTAKSSNQERSDGKLDASLTQDPSGEALKSLEGTMLETQESGTASAGNMCVSPETLDLSHTAAPSSNKEDLSATGSKNSATNLVNHTRNQVNGALSPSSGKGIAEGAVHCSENVEVSPQSEPSKVSSDVSMAIDSGETNQSIAPEQKPPLMLPMEAISDSLENASSIEGAGKVSAFITRIDSPSNLQTTGTACELPPTNVLNDAEVQPSPEISSCQEKTDSASLNLSEKTTLQTLNPSNAVLDLSKKREAAPNGPKLESSLLTSEALTSIKVSGSTQSTTNKDTADPKGPIKVPAFSYVPRVEGSNAKSLTKTQVFLPGASVSAINNKSSIPPTTRSPLLIEIQSECNWGNQRDNILSSIAKHTASTEGGSGVVRVGKFVVEILSKESQAHSVPPVITSSTKVYMKTVNSAMVQPVAAPKVQQSSQPTSFKPFVASDEPRKEVSTTVPEPKAFDNKIRTRSQSKPPPYPDLNTRRNPSFPRPKPPPYPEKSNRPQVPFSMPEPPPYPELNTRPRFGVPMPRLPLYPEFNKKIRFPFSTPRLPQYHEPKPRPQVHYPITTLPPYPEMNTGPHGQFSQPYVQVLPDLSIFPREKTPPPTVRQQLDQKLVTLANAGTVTTTPHNGTVPLLTSLPPGSYLLSDGKNAAGYLVPLAAIKEHIVTPGVESVPQAKPTRSTHPLVTSPPLPTEMTASQKGSIPSYNLVPSILANSDKAFASQTTCLPRVSASTSDASSMIAPCPTSQELSGHSDSSTYSGTGNLLSQSTVTATENEQNVNGQNQLGDDKTLKENQPELGEEGDLVINETSENEIVTQKEDLAADEDEDDDDEDSLVDVESFSDSEEASSLLNPSLMYSFDPAPATIMATAPTPPPSASSTQSSFSTNQVKSRRKAPHVLRQPLSEVDEAGNSYKTPHRNYDIKMVAQQYGTASPVGISQPPTSSKGKRKRKSPVIQKPSVLALDEPEFTEAYFELTSEEEEEESTEEQRRATRDKPNKQMHLIKERQRREDQRSLFSELKMLMLNEDDQRVAKVTILGMALKEIKLLEANSFKIEVECNKLKQENHLKRSKLASLLGHSIMDFPLPLLDENEQDFAEYSKDLHSSQGFVSATASETASQDMDSECADLSSLEDDDDKGSAVGNSGLMIIEQQERDTTWDEEFVDVESSNAEDEYATLMKPYPGSRYALGDVVMAEGTSNALPASPRDNGAGDRHTYEDSGLFSQDDPTLAFPMKLTAASKSPAAVSEDEDDAPASPAKEESRVQDTVDYEHETENSKINIMDAEERTVLKEHPTNNQTNNNLLEQSSTSPSDDVTESIKGDNEITPQTSSERALVGNSEAGSPSHSVASLCTNAKDTTMPGGISEHSQRDDESPETLPGSADRSEKYTELKEPPDQSISDNEPKDPISIDVDEESEDDGVEMMDSTPATQTSDSDDVVMVNEDPSPSGNNPAKNIDPTSPAKQNNPNLDSNSERPSEGPVKLNVLAINIKAGIVRVTCDTGEVIPLAVVKASLDGTMQVAVEGDISSEKVEELLSKPEVMECLEKVADQACEKLNKS
ncbi:uncharacterized protein [Asterias amurensis]|uniref:uncharacterized protein n=1 Tax=Asterias amurensis TaxID=7602 RepID=UPI003AB6023A